MAVKRRGMENIERAVKKVDDKRPVCTAHDIKMEYDAGTGRWHCKYPGCPISAYVEGDAVSAGGGRYEGPVAVVVDRRDGKVWLRMAPSTHKGAAAMVLLGNVSLADTTPGISSVDIHDISALRVDGVQVTFDDTVAIDHSGTMRG